MRRAKTWRAASSDHIVEAMARKWSGGVWESAHWAQIAMEASAGPPVTGVSVRGASVVQRGQVIWGPVRSVLADVPPIDLCCMSFVGRSSSH